jgi:hypothetical protein
MVKGSKKLIVVAAAVIILAGVIIKGTLAQYQATTQTDKTISTLALHVKLQMEGNGVDSNGTVLYSADDMKSGIINEKVSAINTGDKDLYVRIRVNKAWYDGQTKVFEKSGNTIDANAIGIHYINQDDWLIPADSNDSNGEDIYIYYKGILKAGQTTSAFMDTFTLLRQMNVNTNQYAGLTAKMRFDAGAVQTVAAGAAMLAEWGVTTSFDNEGNITSLSNQ